jgi:hypothetical protein
MSAEGAGRKAQGSVTVGYSGQIADDHKRVIDSEKVGHGRSLWAG